MATGAELITLFGEEEVLGGSILDLPEKLFNWWKTGATETPVGKVAALPLTLPYKAVRAAEQTVEQLPSAVKGVTKALPLVLLLVAGGVALYLYQSGKKGVKLTGGRY
jgi:hypothetical protein